MDMYWILLILLALAVGDIAIHASHNILLNELREELKSLRAKLDGGSNTGASP